MARIIPYSQTKFLFLAGILFLLCAPLLMVFSPADPPYWPQSFPAIVFSAIGGITLFNVANVFVSSSVARDDQGLGQGIFNTVVQIGTGISLALAATIAHAGGVTANASKMELLRGYRNCFWFSIGILLLPFIGVWFLKGKKASESREEEQNNEKLEELKEEPKEQLNGEQRKKQKEAEECNGEEKLQTLN
jgi:MFS family permease